ncbi:MAG TPA: hypothetical protein VEB64_01005 [Azospirillaceae bacterium]|nr:hypothetical protein [Azospirillaceae bacterium]
MQINPLNQAPIAKSQSQTTSQTNLQPSVVAAQSFAAVTRTVTPMAPQAAGRVDNTASSKSGTQTGQSTDQLANTVSARTSAMAVKPRGSLLDLSV